MGTFTLYLPDSLLAVLDEACSARGETRSAVVRRSLERTFDVIGKNPTPQPERSPEPPQEVQTHLDHVEDPAKTILKDVAKNYDWTPPTKRAAYPKKK